MPNELRQLLISGFEVGAASMRIDIVQALHKAGMLAAAITASEVPTPSGEETLRRSVEPTSPIEK